MKNRKKLLDVLIKNKLTIAFAESITGGFMCSSLVCLPGASNVINGSIITYSEFEKINKLKVSPEAIRQNTVVSEVVSQQMCEGLSKLIKSDISVSITGNAGPQFCDNTNLLESFVTVSYLNQFHTYHLTYKFVSRPKLFNKITCAVFDIILSLINFENN